MTARNKIIAGGMAGATLLGSYVLISNNGATETAYRRTDNPTQTRTVLSSGEKDRDCSDFSAQREAQEFFEENGGPVDDPHNLDRDSDGVVCESLK